MLIDSPYGPEGGGGAGGDDLMAYNAYPSEHSSYSSAFGGSGGSSDTGFMDPDGRAQQQALALAQQQQAQHQPLQQQQQQVAKQQQIVQQQQQQQQQQQVLLQQQQAQALALAQVQATANVASASYLLSPQAVAVRGQQPLQQQQPVALVPESVDDPGYLETLWQRRRDVAKTCVLALAVLLAISAHSAAWHYVREYIETAPKLSYWQEAGIRVAYPAAVLLVLWHLKSFL